MTIVVKFFALSRQLTGQREVAIRLPKGATVAVLMEAVEKRFPKLNVICSFLSLELKRDYAVP